MIKIIVDANVIVAVNNNRDSLNKKASNLLNIVKYNQKIINYFILSEIATILLQKTKNLAHVTNIITYLNSNTKISNFTNHRLTKNLLTETINIFQSQKSLHLSFADCSLIAQARSQKIKHIASFDKDLRKEFKKEFVFLPTKL